MSRKNQKKLILNLTITGIAEKGKCVARDEEGRVIFVEEGAAPGDVVDVMVYKKKKGFYLGNIHEVHRYSEERVTPFCGHFGVCGGCTWQHLRYDAQLKHKQMLVENAFLRIGKIPVGEMLPILGADPTEYYRNKLEFAFSNRRWLTSEEIASGVSNLDDVLGFHRSGAFDKVLDIHHCWLQPDPSNAIRNGVRDLAKHQGLSFFDIRAQQGFLRNLLIRVTAIGEVLVLISFFEDDPKKITRLLDALLERFPLITTLIYCINPKANDFLLDLDMITYFGKGYIEEKLKDVRFKIGPKSFFQTNSRQAEHLYDVAVDFAGLSGVENVYDLYTGIGSIALYLARGCRQVVGIEEVPEAIDDARENARLNGIDNAVFYAGDVKDMLSEAFIRQHGKPDVLITDPPRAGMHPKVVELLAQLEAPKIVYVSCNPATQARDLNLLNEKYEVRRIRPVDMFPHTHHVENVALLHLKAPV